MDTREIKNLIQQEKNSATKKQVYLIYKTDCWHSHNSKVLIGLATDIFIALEIIKDQAKIEGERIREEEIIFLLRHYQTQTYRGEGEFMIEKEIINERL